jgi:hypothetical protein
MDIVAQPHALYPYIQSYNNQCSSEYRYIYETQKESFFTTLAIKDSKKIYDADTRRPA